MNVAPQTTEHNEEKNCRNCRHCIDIPWTEKITCMAYLDVRYPTNPGACAEFAAQVRKENSQTLPVAA